MVADQVEFQPGGALQLRELPERTLAFAVQHGARGSRASVRDDQLRTNFASLGKVAIAKLDTGHSVCFCVEDTHHLDTGPDFAAALPDELGQAVDDSRAAA